MPVVYHCPHCHQPVTVPDNVLGQAVTCPQCRGAFQTFPAQPMTPAAAPQNPLSLDDDDPPAHEDAGGDGFDTLGTSSRRGRAGSGPRRAAEKKGLPLPNLFALIAVMIGTAITMAYNQANRRPGQGFDVREVLISGVVGAVCGGVGFGIGKLIEGNSSPAPKRRGRRDDD